jgi:hypothetical protein
MNSIEEYQNLVNLLKEALKFYADENNYMPITLNGSLFAPVHLDHGSQAQFALKQAEDLTIQIQKMQDEYDKLIAGYDQLQASGDIADIDKLKQIFKLMGNEDNDI